MYALTTWDPFRELDEVSNRLFGRTRNGNKTALWSPAVDITENDKEYRITAELPDMKKEDVHVSVGNGVLTLRGERKFEAEQKEEKALLMERSYGSFTRSFTIPEDADGERVSAEYKNGVLKVSLPKSEKAKPKAIDIKVS